MKEAHRVFLSRNKYILIILIIFTFFASFNLNNRYLWNDEAYLSCLAINTIKYGYPLAYDGKNVISGINGNDLNKDNIHIAYPWLQFYITGLSLKVFGINTVAARLPYVIFGLLSVIVFFLLSKLISRNDKFITYTGTIVLAFSTCFLYDIRMAKYFVYIHFFGLTTFYFYVKYIHKFKLKYLILFTIFAFLLFNSHYVAFIGIFGSIILYHFIVIKKKNFPFVISCLIVILTNIPWLIYSQKYIRECARGTFLGLIDGWEIASDHFFTSLWQINVNYFPFISLVFILIIILAIVKVKKLLYKNNPSTKNGLKFLNIYSIPIGIILINVLVFNIFITLRLCWWYSSIIPFGALLTGIILKRIQVINKWISIALLILIIFTNTLNVLPYRMIDFFGINPLSVTRIVKPGVTSMSFTPPNIYGYIKHETDFKTTYLEFFEAIFGDYNSAAEGVIKYLKTNALPGQKIQPGFLCFELMFYTDLTVANIIYDGEAYGPISNLMFGSYPNAKRLMGINYFSWDEIDWFVEFPRISVPSLSKNYLIENRECFEKIYIDYPDIFDSPFYRVTPKNATGIYLYKRIKPCKELISN